MIVRKGVTSTGKGCFYQHNINTLRKHHIEIGMTFLLGISFGMGLGDDRHLSCLDFDGRCHKIL